MTPVVLVHGLSGSARWWRQVERRLADVHAVDLPRAHPHDAPTWLIARLDELEIERADLVGHSLGGLICARLAATAPERVRRLVLVAPAGVPSGRRMLAHGPALLASVADAPARVPRIAIDALKAGPGLLRAALYAASHDLRDELSQVRAPTLLVWGDRDRLLPARLAGEWETALPSARVLRIRAGHVPMWDAPGELAAAVLDFLQESANDVRDEPRPGVVDGVRLTGDDPEAPVG